MTGYKHGYRYTPEYRVWLNMKSRCNNSNHPQYKDYGGRGISVCDEWVTSFPTFLRDVGEKPSHEFQLDRIDNNGNYCKENCRWISPKKNMRNKRDNHMITINGETKCLSEWSEERGVNYWTICDRYRKGIRGEDIFKPGKRGRPRKH